MGDDVQERAMAQLLHMRGVNSPCEKCHGLGVYLYPSTAVWRGGMGGAMMTHGTCDECWGSGDKHRHGTNIRALEAKRADWEREQALAYLSSAFGIRIGRLRWRFRALADLADKQARKRKVPDGEDAFWWARDWEAVAGLLRSITKEQGDG